MATKPKFGSKEWLAWAIAIATGRPDAASFTVGAEASNVILVTAQLKDAHGVAIAVATPCKAWLSTTAGAAVAGTAPNAATSFTTGITLKEHTTKLVWDVVTNAAGQLVLSISDTGTPTFFLNIALPGGIVSSTAITFA